MILAVLLIIEGSLPHRVMYAYSLAGNDPSGCGMIKKQYYRDNCFESVAINKNDLSLCEQVASSHDRGVCYLKIAESLNNASICEKIEEPDARISCLTGLS